jgi:hypothetical protein
MDEINYDLEDKINLIYDYLYNLNSKNCFSFNKISLGKIGLDDIKIPFPSDNKEEREYYDKNKSDILNGRFKLLSFNDSTYELLFKRYSNQFPVNVKVSFYKNSSDINLMDDNVNNDSLFSYILSQLVLAKKTEHILLPVINLDANFSDIENFTVDDNSNSIIKNGILNNKITDKCCIQLREHFFRTVNLENHLVENICSYKILLFQIIHTLATIQKEFDGFRHNNLILSNILVYLKKSSETVSEYEGFKNDKFYVPNASFDIKITNFENAIIPKFYGLKNVRNTEIKFADQHNPYYDLYVFLNDLLEGTTKMSSYSEGNKCDTETKKFLDRIIPPHIRGLSMNNFNKNMVVVKPVDLLYDSYFDEYRNKPSKNLVGDSITNHLYLTGKESKKSQFNTFMDSDNYSVLGNQDKIISNYNIMNKKSNSRTLRKEESNKKISRISGGKILDDVEDEETISTVNSENKRIIKTYDETQLEKINRTNKTELKGGSIETAPYKAEKNTPFLSNDQRDTFKKRSTENPFREPPVILEQKVYDTSQKPASKPQFPPTFIPLYDQEGQMMDQLLPYSNRVINQPPVQKVYNVSLSNPIQGFTSINRIHEDVLPGEAFSYSALTLFERKQLIDFFRNNVLDHGDGEEMTTTGGKNSLLEYIKILDVNPYTVKSNPYMDLARRFLIYRAGYPIRYDDKTKLINMAKSSMGLNVRMYGMSIGDLRCKTINNLINSDNFDLWREMKYYDWVRNDIIKKKVSPNFISPVLYKIDSQSRIDWDKLDILRNKNVTSESVRQLKENDQKVNLLHELDKNLGIFQGLVPLQFRKQLGMALKNKEDAATKDKLKLEDKEDLTINSGKVLVLLTEAPTSNIIQWSSAIYESFGSVKKMISTGFHTPDVWKCILFQLVYACTVLQEKQILIEKFSLENNIYIKDIFADANSIGSWIYKVNGVEYYIPNYGYILMIDSKYTDFEIDDRLLKSKASDNIRYKMYGKIFNENSHFNNVDLSALILNKFKELIDPDNFGHNFRVKGGSIPDDSIIELLKKMYNDSSITKISDFIPKYFGEFVHNRVGTLLTKNEKDNINILSRPNFVRGNLMIWQKRFQEYEWVIDLGEFTLDGLKRKVLVKDGNNYLPLEVFVSSLYSYPSNEKILPDSSNKMKFDEAHIYETYNLDNLS